MPRAAVPHQHATSAGSYHGSLDLDAPTRPFQAHVDLTVGKAALTLTTAPSW